MRRISARNLKFNSKEVAKNFKLISEHTEGMNEGLNMNHELRITALLSKY